LRQILDQNLKLLPIVEVLQYNRGHRFKDREDTNGDKEKNQNGGNAIKLFFSCWFCIRVDTSMWELLETDPNQCESITKSEEGLQMMERFNHFEHHIITSDTNFHLPESQPTEV